MKRFTGEACITKCAATFGIIQLSLFFKQVLTVSNLHNLFYELNFMRGSMSWACMCGYELETEKYNFRDCPCNSRMWLFFFCCLKKLGTGKICDDSAFKLQYISVKKLSDKDQTVIDLFSTWELDNFFVYDNQQDIYFALVAVCSK